MRCLYSMNASRWCRVHIRERSDEELVSELTLSTPLLKLYENSPLLKSKVERKISFIRAEIRRRSLPVLIEV